MIKKEKLLEGVDSLINLENSALPLLNRHLSSAISFSELNKDDHDKLMEEFQKIAVKRSRHIEILTQIKEEVLRKKADVY